MKRYYLLFLFALYGSLLAQTLKPSFDPNEFLDVLRLEWAHQDSTSSYKPDRLPENYKRVYSSPEVGLSNKFDVWLRNDSVGVICVRYTVGGVSWLGNFYSGMIKANGILTLNDSTKFPYRFAADDKAYVHHGWAIGACHLLPYITRKITEYRQKGIKQFIIVGHSQGAALSYLIRSYLEYAPAGMVPRDVTYKVYCSAAPKPGNSFYANDFDFITRGGWAYRIINNNDWVTQTPFTIQSVNDLHPLNPFLKRKEILRKRTKPIIRWYVNHAINDMDRATRKANRKYEKYLTRRIGKFIRQRLKQYHAAPVENSNFYVSAGTPVILMPDASYDEKFKYDGKNVFIHHMFEAYIYLTEINYLR